MGEFMLRRVADAKGVPNRETAWTRAEECLFLQEKVPRKMARQGRSAATIRPLFVLCEGLLDEAHAIAPRRSIGADAIEVAQLGGDDRGDAFKRPNDLVRSRPQPIDAACRSAARVVHRNADPNPKCATVQRPNRASIIAR